MQRLSKYLVFEITRKLSLKTTLKLSGVCRALHRKVHYMVIGNKICEGKISSFENYICLRKDGEKNQTILNKLLYNLVCIFVYRDSSVHAIEILLKAGANPNYQKEGTSVLSQIISYNCKDSIELLLQKNRWKIDLNVNEEIYRGSTPLMEACAGKTHIEIVKLLLDNGANVNHQDMYGNTPMIVAHIRGHKDIVSLLLTYGAPKIFDPNILC